MSSAQTRTSVPKKAAPKKATSKKARRKKATPKKTPRRGRPAGATTQDLPVVAVSPSRCPYCGSTQRAPYTNLRHKTLAGVHPEHGPYTSITWKRTRCLACGRSRDDRIYENRAD